MIQTPHALLRTAHSYWQGCCQVWFRHDPMNRDPRGKTQTPAEGKQGRWAESAHLPGARPPEIPPDSPPARGDGDLRGLDPADVDYFNRGADENPEFWWRLVDRPQFSGKHVLDVGCGLGSLCVDMAAGGAARVVGLDTEAKLIAFARQHTAQAFPELQPVLEFYDEDLARFNQGKFDIIVSKDSFEHIMDLEGMIRAMACHLKPGGRIYSGFGPLYNSPFGHHGRVATRLPWRQFPWAHLWESEAKIVQRLNRLRARGEPVFTYSDAPLTSIRDLGLSMYSLADYRRFIYGSGLKVVRFEVNRSKHGLSRVLSVLRRVPFLEEYCTHNIYCVLEKPH
jgi:SAM-dependent methyltransferase